MTKEQARALIRADDEEFRKLASEYSFDLSGPSFAGFFLIRVPRNGKAFLFTPYPSEAKRANQKRTFVDAVWSARTLAIINSQQPDDKPKKRPRSSEIEDLGLALAM